MTRTHEVVFFSTAACLAGLARAALEHLTVYSIRGETLPFAALVDYVAYYAAIGGSVRVILQQVGAVSPDRAWRWCTLGFALAALPPFIDVTYYGLGEFHYLYGSEVPPAARFAVTAAGMPLGEVTALATVVAGAAATTFWERRRVLPSIAVLLITAVAVVFHIYLLPLAARAWDTWVAPLGTRGTLTLAQAWWCPLLGVLESRERWWYVVRRARHIAPWGLAVLIGVSLSDAALATGGTVAILMMCLFLALIVENDLQDVDEDRHSGWLRPFDAHDNIIFRLASILTLLAVSATGTLTGVAMCLFWLTGFAYSVPPLRWKTGPFPAMYVLEGTWGACAVAAGMDSAGMVGAKTILITALVFIGFLLASPVKDMKDTVGDRAAGVRSLPVCLAERGVNEGGVRRVVAALVTIPALSATLALVVSGLLPWLGGVVASIVAVLTGLSVLRAPSGERVTRAGLVGLSAFMVAVLLGRLG